MTALILAAAEAAEPSKTPFYVAGGLLAAWAVVVSAIGIRRPDFPGAKAVQGVVLAISALLVVAAASTAVIVS